VANPPARPDTELLCHQAKDLLRAAASDDPAAPDRIRAHVPPSGCRIHRWSQLVWRINRPAMVADNQPITHPKKSKRKVCSVPLPASADTTAKMTAHIAAQPMLYAV
jgi:hypothetical protein